MLRALLFITTTLTLAGHQHMLAQVVTTQEPPTTLPSAPVPQIHSLPQPADIDSIPRAVPYDPVKQPDRAIIESDRQTRDGDLYTASGTVELTYGDRTLRADTLTYNKATGEVTLAGHVHVSGGENGESIQASHATYNLNTQTGRFYDVSGSVGLPDQADRRGYVNANPFLFTGRTVVKTGPTNYEIYDGSVTSCQLPHPDWQLFGKKFTLSGPIAHATNSTFKLLGVPVLFLPYVTHPVNSEDRQSGLLIPVLGYSSASNHTGSKGITVGDQAYLVLGRSADLTVGGLYFSLRGFSENSTFRYRGLGDDFLNLHLNALQDRGFYAPTVIITGGVTSTINLYTNQGGQDVTSAFRKRFTPNTRVVGDGEYLSSYIYREAFTENFNQAVSSDITSTLFLTRQANGLSLDARVDRYQGEKVVPIQLTAGEEVKIFHAPSLDLTQIDHILPGTPLLWSLAASSAGLKRVQPTFTSAGITERLDLRPELSLPLAFQGWHTLSSVSARETFYSRSRQVPYAPNGTNPPNATPIELTQNINRASVELNIDIRPPVIERTFAVPPKYRWLLGSQLRHTLEASVDYRNVHGIDNFLGILRFDDNDLIADTDEVQYGLLQHLYFRPRAHAPRPTKPNTLPPCPVSANPASPNITRSNQAPGLAAAVSLSPSLLADSQEADDTDQAPSNDANGIPNVASNAPDLPTRTRSRRPTCTPVNVPQQEWFSWQLTQKHYFAQNFGGAVINNRRNIFDTTLDISGVAFLTEPRSTSPLISRMRFRTSSHTDIEWDFDYDTGATKFTSQNVFFDTHEGPVFGGFSFARLNAPGRFRTEVINSVTNTATGLTSSAVSDFTQIRVLLGYGTPTRPGFAAAASAGIDLDLASAQYVTIQSSYNWNCCGLSIEYRKYDLGTIRNEGAYRFNFTLANIGTAGNLRRTDALF